MSQDVVADALNNIMNAKRAKKKSVKVKRYSKLLLTVLKIAKENGYVEEYKLNENKELEIKFDKLNMCRAIKPRFFVSKEDMDKYLRRYLPSRNFGILIITTNKGVITHKEAQEKNVGGALVAYFY